MTHSENTFCYVPSFIKNFLTLSVPGACLSCVALHWSLYYLVYWNICGPNPTFACILLYQISSDCIFLFWRMMLFFSRKHIYELSCNLFTRVTFCSEKWLYAKLLTSCCFSPQQVVKINNESINAVDDSEGCLFSKASLNLQVSYFKETLLLIENILPQGMMHALLVMFSF